MGVHIQEYARRDAYRLLPFRPGTTILRRGMAETMLADSRFHKNSIGLRMHKSDNRLPRTNMDCMVHARNRGAGWSVEALRTAGAHSGSIRHKTALPVPRHWNRIHHTVKSRKIFLHSQPSCENDTRHVFPASPLVYKQTRRRCTGTTAANSNNGRTGTATNHRRPQHRHFVLRKT